MSVRDKMKDEGMSELKYNFRRVFESWSIWDYSGRTVYLLYIFASFTVGYTWRRLKCLVRYCKESLCLGFASFISKEFEYSPLSKPSLIRLLYLKDGSETDIIQCSLRVVDIDNAPEYRSLSYTWKLDKSPWIRSLRKLILRAKEMKLLSPFAFRLLSLCGNVFIKSPRRLILCNGQVMEVQTNLYNALLQLRKTHNSLPFWIDAVCINQKDISERNAQMEIMGDIYTSARQVIAWLGTCPTALIGRGGSIRSFPQPRDEIMTNETATLLPLHLQYQYFFEPMFDMTLLLYIVVNSYFRRIWVLQESILARDLIFLIGPEEMAPEALADAFRWMKDTELYHSTRYLPLYVFPALFPYFWSLDTVLAARSLFCSGDKWDLEQYLVASRGREATDPRDLVFAGLALLSPGSLKMDQSTQLNAHQNLDTMQKNDEILQSNSQQSPNHISKGSDILTSVLSQSSGANPPPATPAWEELHADYALQPLEVFSKWAAAMLYSRTGFYSFSLASIRSSYDGYSSWFPIPGKIEVQTLRDVKPNIYNACPLPNTFEISLDSREIWLAQSVTLDKITSISREDLFKILDDVTGLTKFFDTLTQMNTSAYKWKEPSYLTIARLLVGNSCDGNYPARDDVGEMFGKWLRDLVANTLKENLNFPGLEALQTSYEAFVAKHLPYNPATFDESDVTASAKVYQLAHQRLCALRTIFVSDKGYIGLGPKAMASGGYVVFIGGAYVPFIMRRDDNREKEGRVKEGSWSSETSYHLLGEAYLYGFMDGEVLEDEKVVLEPIIIN